MKHLLHGLLWALQALLAASFGVAGYRRLAWPVEDLAREFGWVTALPEPVLRTIGALELAWSSARGIGGFNAAAVLRAPEMGSNGHAPAG